jgi:hypothetical protein
VKVKRPQPFIIVAKVDTDECVSAFQVPIIAHIKHKKIEVEERTALKTNYSNEFLTSLMANPELVRNVVVVGHLHHGKTIVRLGTAPLFGSCPVLGAEPC